MSAVLHLSDEELGQMVGLPTTRRFLGTFEGTEGPPKAGTRDEQLREEITRDDGTPAWREWVERSAQRNGVT